jgi:AraC-like DNA-binding protein
LASRRYPITEVAALVGFAQQSAFQRAFKLWSGQTPSEFRARAPIKAVPVAPTDRRDSIGRRP